MWVVFGCKWIPGRYAPRGEASENNRLSSFRGCLPRHDSIRSDRLCSMASTIRHRSALRRGCQKAGLCRSNPCGLHSRFLLGHLGCPWRRQLTRAIPSGVLHRGLHLVLLRRTLLLQLHTGANLSLACIIAGSSSQLLCKPFGSISAIYRA